MSQRLYKPLPNDGECEVPMNPCQALAAAFASIRPRSQGPTTNDVADAAFALADLKAPEVGWDIRKGHGAEPLLQCAEMLSIVMAGPGKTPTPRHQSDAERVVIELRNMDFDMVKVGNRV